MTVTVATATCKPRFDDEKINDVADNDDFIVATTNGNLKEANYDETASNY